MDNNYEYVGPLEWEPVHQGRHMEIVVGDTMVHTDVSEEWRDPKHPDFQPSIYERPLQIDITPVGGIQKAVKGVISKYAASVNLEKQAISEGAKAIERSAAQQAPRLTQTWDQTGKISREILSDYSKASGVLAKARGGQGLTAAEIDAARQVNVNAVSKLKEMAETLPPEQLQKQFHEYVENIFRPTSSASGEIGRALNIHKKTVSVNRVANAFTKLERGLRPRELEEFRALNLEDPVQVERFVNRLGDPKLRDYLYEYWYNAILSGPPTHIVNVVSNTAWGMFQVPHRALTSGVDRVYSMLTGEPRTRFLNELVPMMGGMKTGFKRGRGAAWDVVKTGEIKEFETKWAKEVGYAMGAFERSPYPVLQKVGKFITPPTKALRGMDVWANSIAYDSHARALARRASNAKGLKGPARDNFERGFIKNLPEKAHEEAMEYAKYNTFTDDPGKFSSWIMEGRDKFPGGRLVIPFVRTIGNLLKRGVEMTPGVGLTVAKGQPVPEVIAKQLEGAMLSMYVMHKVDKGEITGAAPESKAARDAFYRQGKKAWSMKVGDTWVQYRRIEPVNTVIASAAIAWDKIKNAKTEDDAFEAFYKATSDFKDNLIDSSYLQGVSQILNRHGKIGGALQRTGASFVPYSGFWRSINRAYEAQAEGSAKIRDTSTWLGAFSQVIPGLYGKVPPKMNIWGEDIELPGGVFRQWLPYRWVKETDDPVEIEFERLGFYPGLPKQKVTIKGEPVELPDELYKKYVISFASKAKARMNDIISRDSYKRKPMRLQNRRIRSEFTKIRARALTRAKLEYKRGATVETEDFEYIGPIEQ